MSRLDPHSRGVIILDFGSQYTQLIARRIREQHVFSEILLHDTSLSEINAHRPRALILSGGPASVFADDAPEFDPGIFDLDCPILGVCYGLQLMVHRYGGRIEQAPHGEYGLAHLKVIRNQGLLTSVRSDSQVWMSHMDRVTQLPEKWELLGESSNGIPAAIQNGSGTRFATQFHPEVAHTSDGEIILRNFLFDVARCQPDWTPGHFIDEQTNIMRETVGDKRVLIGVSGGVDSSVVAALTHRAIGDQAVAVLIDHGLLRKNEAHQCITALKGGLGVNIHLVDEQDTFLEKLDGIKDPEQKRKIIGEQFIRSFEKVAAGLENIQFLAQGTLYPDVIESGNVQTGGQAAVIKSHHNVGGLPDTMNFDLLEPLRDLFKDEVRNVGHELGLPESLIRRHPFPGPGLAVRVLGEITPERVHILQEADDIYMSILREENLYDEIWQAFAVLIPVRTVGVMGDQRTYENVLGLRAVTSTDGMTADWFPMPDKVLNKISNRIVNSVRGINRVVYDITSKPPGTIEWE